jgi:hypothetical protein
MGVKKYKDRPRRDGLNHLITAPNVYNDSRGYKYCLACKKAKWYWSDNHLGEWTLEYYKLADHFYEEIMGFSVQVQEIEKTRREGKCQFGHRVVEPNLYTRKGNGYSSCLACNRGNSYCSTHPDSNLHEEADRYYEKIMAGLGHLRRSDW